jgi:hypothetical protein
VQAKFSQLAPEIRRERAITGKQMQNEPLCGLLPNARKTGKQSDEATQGFWEHAKTLVSLGASNKGILAANRQIGAGLSVATESIALLVGQFDRDDPGSEEFDRILYARMVAHPRLGLSVFSSALGGFE